VIFLDTSWLVKLYVDEEDSEHVRGRVQGSVALSDIAFVEFHSSVHRRLREEALSPAAAEALVSRFRRDWSAGVDIHVRVAPEVLLAAADLLGRHPLRTLDALQLASAMVVAAGAPEHPTFGTADERLRSAAEAEGFALA
jgi:predicted nucleic acid-binding protein